MFNLCFIFLRFALHFLPTTWCFPPQDPIQCSQSGCTLSNTYGVWNDKKACHVSKATYPKIEEELRLAVAYANKNKLKIKLVSKFSHTIVCPENQKNMQNSMLISTAKYDSDILIDVNKLAVTVDAGVGLRELIDKVEAAGLSLVAAPFWEGVSVGGVISTGHTAARGGAEEELFMITLSD